MNNLPLAHILLFALFSIGSISAQVSINKFLSSYQSAIGGNSTMLSGIYSIQGNPAGIADSKKSFSLIINSEQRYFLSSLNSSFIGAIRKLGSHDFTAFSVANFGIAEYKEQKYSISYSRKIAENTFIGSSFNFYNFRIDQYGNRTWWNVDVGMKSSISKFLIVGFFIRNVLPHPLLNNTDDAPLFAFGIQYILSEKVFLVSELQKPSNHSLFISFGLNYNLLENLSLQAGTNNSDFGSSFGFIYKINSTLHFSGGLRSNQYLGLSPHVGFVVHFI